MRGTNVQNARYQRCEHPGFPGDSSVCNVLVSWTNPSPRGGSEGVGESEGVASVETRWRGGGSEGVGESERGGKRSKGRKHESERLGQWDSQTVGQ
eukprot:9503830-Pyramimonas_sp.AAC.9